MPCVCLCYVLMDLNCNIFAVRGVARQKEVNNGHMIRDPLVIVMNDGLMTRVMNTGHMIGVKGKGHMTEVMKDYMMAVMNNNHMTRVRSIDYIIGGHRNNNQMNGALLVCTSLWLLVTYI